MKNKAILVLILCVLIVLPVVGQTEVFKLVALKKGENFTYYDTRRDKYIQYNITRQTVYGQGISALFANALVANDSTSLELFETNTILQFLTYNLTLGKLLSSHYLKTAKGNFLINGEEQRPFTLIASNGTVLYNETLYITANFSIANRAFTVFSGDPVTDDLAIMMMNTPIRSKAQFLASIAFSVSYIPSDVFSITYKQTSYTAINITESFDFKVSSVALNLSAYEPATPEYEAINKITNQLTYTLPTTKYVFAKQVGLPILIEKGITSPVFAKLKSNTGFHGFTTPKRSLTDTFELYKASWISLQRTNASFSSPIIVFIAVLFTGVLTLLRTKKRKQK